MNVGSQRLRRAVALAVSGGVLLTSAACGWAAGGGSQTGGARPDVTAAVSVAVPSMDPVANFSSYGTALYANVFDALIYIAPDGQVQPNLATDWSSPDDGLTWDVTIRGDARFSDGSPVTVDDVVFSYRKAIEPESPFKGTLGDLKSVQAVDERTVRFVNATPRADFPNLMNYIYIVPQEKYEADPESFNSTPIGSGPYVVSSFSANHLLELKANPEYWGDQPEVKTAALRVTPNLSSAVSALQAGDVDMISAVPPEQVVVLEDKDEITVTKYGTNRFLFLGMNVQNPALDDTTLRRAMNLAVDREGIAEVLHGHAEPIGQLGTPALFGWDDSIPAMQQDQDEARRLVEESSYEGQEIVIDFPTDRFSGASNVAQLLAENLHEVGINATVSGEPMSTWLPKYHKAATAFETTHFSSFGPSAMDISGTYDAFVVSSGRDSWQNEQAHELQRRQLATLDDAERRDLLSQLAALVGEQLPYLPLVSVSQSAATADFLTWTPRADEAVRFAEIDLK